MLNIIHMNDRQIPALKIVSYVLLAIGLAFVTVSLVNLGRSTRLGLPTGETQFKTSGLYRISRNPMYIGFDLITLASVLYLWNPFIAVAGIYSIVIYHFIILGEEKFMENKFGDEYNEYKKKVGRYI